MTALLIINDAPYGSERTFDALRLTMASRMGQDDAAIRIFLMADAVGCAVAGQTALQSYYNLERMVRSVLSKGGLVSFCGTCADARGLAQVAFAEGVARGSMDQLALWTVDADRVLTF